VGPPAEPLERPPQRRPVLRYVADHYDLPALTGEQVDAIAAPDPTLSMDDLVADHVRAHFGFRVVEAADYSAALATENAIKAGALSAGPPRLDPARHRRRAA